MLFCFVKHHPDIYYEKHYISYYFSLLGVCLLLTIFSSRLKSEVRVVGRAR